jgi:hypothetical protein
MAMRTVDFEVTGKDGVQAFWIAVGKDDVRLVNGKGSKDLDDTVEHFLIWWFTGDPGGKLAIVGKVGEGTVVEVKESKIPKKRIQAAGAKPFRLK